MFENELRWESDLFKRIAKEDLLRAIKLSFLLLVAGAGTFYAVFRLKDRGTVSQFLILLALIMFFLAIMFVVDATRNYLRNRNSITYKVDGLGISLVIGASNYFYPWDIITGYKKVNSLYEANFYKFPSAKENIQESPILKILISLIYGRRASSMGESIEAFALTFSQINKKVTSNFYVLSINHGYQKNLTLDVPSDYGEQLESKFKNIGKDPALTRITHY